MATNALEWLERYRDRPVWDHCRETTPEVLEPGDVRDDGAILTVYGTAMDHGYIWLSEHKADAAEYYGWQRMAGMPTATDVATGLPMFAMQR